LEGNRSTEKQHILGQHLIWVALDNLNVAPGPYTMSFGFDQEPLCDSIRRIGLVNPPCIAKDQDGQIEIVTGYRRILVLKQLGWVKVGCEDLTSSLPSASERLLFAFYENLASRTFNPVEKAMVLARFTPLLKKEDILNIIMPLLLIASHEDTLNFYIGLAELKSDIKEALVRGRLSLKAAKALLNLEPGSRECVFRWISNLSLSFNQQLQYIDIMMDLSIIHKKSCSQIMGCEPFQNILEDERLNNPQKAKKILDELCFLRYPKWRGAEKRFKEKLHLLNFPKGTRLDHPPFFEAPGYRLEVQFREGRELMEKLQQLFLLSGLQEFEDPFSRDD
jgi:ParB/Sulfiredoxin domain